MRIGLLAVLFLTTVGCVKQTEVSIPSREFGKDSSGGSVQIYTLKNSKGMEIQITPYGATLVSVKVPDRKGDFADVVLGFDSLEGYTQKPAPPYFGATIGRYGNRIAAGKFSLNGKTYSLAINNGPNSLHGGNVGFDKVMWTARPGAGGDDQSIELSYLSKDGEEGYPGNLAVTVKYTLTEENEIRLHYTATTDQDTVFNPTNHSYFNLAGHDSGDILGHVVTINADQYTPVDAGLIPTGELRKVAGTPFDFRTPHTVGERINAADEQTKLGGGYDHNWVLNRTTGLEWAARVEEPKSGRVIDCYTTEPGLQFYTSNFLDGTFHGKGGAPYQRRAALTLETQHYPDSPNHPSFPTTVVKPGQPFESTTVFRFSAK
ncbi:MAG TPA: aldose epimerase family protein [Bryobacteraceae bacterium]|jgi:aldose 1-epimerase